MILFSCWFDGKLFAFTQNHDNISTFMKVKHKTQRSKLKQSFKDQDNNLNSTNQYNKGEASKEMISSSLILS